MKAPRTANEQLPARFALADCRELVAAGMTPHEAVLAACTFERHPWGDWVLERLTGQRSVIRDVINTRHAADVLARCHGNRARAEALRRAVRTQNRDDAVFWRDVAAQLIR